jgi:hypothetical protein
MSDSHGSSSTVFEIPSNSSVKLVPLRIAPTRGRDPTYGS